MDKEFMLMMVRKRLEELKKKHRKLIQSMSTTDYTTKTYKNEAQARAYCKKQMNTLRLIEELLITSKAVFIEADDACRGFDSLVESRK